ncbi:hypothetical protein QQZ08_004230 [Neonectria magnoliae]|uniref:Uncharacterized protein n=1 Tax=Neonectria magnoliae TaxID=2732573 RepID=A0ABR1I6Y1_9HYPO
MKVSVIALLGFLAAGVIAGGDDDYKKSDKCKKIEWEPAQCKSYYDGKGPRGVSDMEERGEYSYPPPVCKKKCPKDKVHCEEYGWAKGSPRYEGNFFQAVDCKKGNDYKVSGTLGPCGYGSKKDCLVVKYSGNYWPADKKTSYLGVYERKSDGVAHYSKLNYNGYCYGDKCTVPVEKLPGYPKLCGDTLYVAVDTGRCQNPYSDYGYGKKKEVDKISYVKLEIECTGKKECKKSCCKVY